MGEFFINFVLKTKIVMFGLCLAVENQIKPFKAILSIRVRIYEVNACYRQFIC